MSAPITLLSSIVEHRESRSGGVTVVQFDPAGEPHAKALVDAVVGHYHRITSRTRPDLTVLRGLTGVRVTIAYTSRGTFGGSFIEAREGTLMPPTDYLADYHPDDTRLVLRPAGARSRAVALDATDVLDVERGYGHLDRLRGLVALCQTRLPRLQALTRADPLALPTYEVDEPDIDEWHDSINGIADDQDGNDEDAPTLIRLAVMGTWRGPDGDCPAAIWLLHSYDPEADIAEGYLLVDPAHGYSEHGSFYGRDLLRFGGRIVLPNTVTERAGSTTSPAASTTSSSTSTATATVVTKPDGQPLTLTDCFALGDLPQEKWLAYFTR